jgi:protein TonB
MNARLGNLALVIALHAVVLAAILAHAPTRRAIAEAVPVAVRFIEIQPPAPAAPPAPPKRAEAEKPKPVETPKLVAKARPAPLAPPLMAAAPQPTVPATSEAPIAPPHAEPAPAAPAATAPAPTATAAAPSASMLAPSFNADYLRNPAPAYPPLSRRLGEEGRVVLRVFVAISGEAERIELRSSSGYPRLDEVALDTVRKWKFVPAKQGDTPIAAWVLVPISFSLRG